MKMWVTVYRSMDSAEMTAHLFQDFIIDIDTIQSHGKFVPPKNPGETWHPDVFAHTGQVSGQPT